jgi:acetylornithine deacetylase/succinyl-diaminopimelate desuccinylase-like protein
MNVFKNLCLVIGTLGVTGTSLATAESQGTAQAQTAPLSPPQQFARDIFRELVEINTTTQFGSTRAAEVIAARLQAANFQGSSVQLVGPRPDKMNLVARLRGSDDVGRAKPVLFIAHLDVVEARKQDWSSNFDPFRFIEQGGFFYGRGTADVKGEVAGLVSNLIRLKQEGYTPMRDIIVALTADEEGGDANGVNWLLQNRRELIDAAYCINVDAGGGQIENGERVRYNVQTSEKASVSFRLEVKNAGGHSSQPVRDNAIYHLAGGLVRLAQYSFPVRLNDTTRVFFERMSHAETGQVARDMRAVARRLPDSAAAARLSARSPFFNSLMRNTCVATMLDAGHAYNALPQTARATVNCRVLPDDSQASVAKTLTEVLADTLISVTPIREMIPSPASPFAPEIVRPIEQTVAEMWPDIPIVPVLDPAASDGLYLRRAGVAVYGVPGIFTDIDPIRAHGKDERIRVNAFYEGVEFMYRLMKATTSPK